MVFLIQDNGELEHPAVLCTAVLTRGNRIAPLSFALSDCAEPDGMSHDGVVIIMTGDEVSEFKGLDFVEVPLIDVDGFHTPPTPDSDE